MNWRSLLVLVTILSSSLSINIEGEFDSKNFFLFLNKFGFEKTEVSSESKATYGYIFGNITSSNNTPSKVTLAVLDRHHFLEFYGNR
jgi:hypothetical protein